MTVKRGDQVRVMTGKDRGKQGRVLKVIPREARILVEGVNLTKRHMKLRPARGRSGQEGGIVEREAAIAISNVQVLCPSCGPTRVGHNVQEDGLHVRVCRKCGGEL
ncbi:MAG TPA: 50S ribosomal protein L24 [Actinomycetota bacterium]|nr:50S ribosomal protein L24 [Actinomycetota bacterium]